MIFRGMRKTCNLKIRHHTACLIDGSAYLSVFPWVKSSEKSCETELNEKFEQYAQKMEQVGIFAGV